MQNSLPDFLVIPSAIIGDDGLQPLDGYVYGVVYWYTKLKLEKCIASNKDLATRLGASVSGIANSLSRLNKRGYIQVVMDENNHRLEIIPLVTMAKNAGEPLLKSVTPLTQPSMPPYSNEEHNNKDLIRRFNTVNGDENIFAKLPNISISEEEKGYVVGEILNVLKDEQSKPFYLLVASKVPQSDIFQNLSESRQEGQDPKKLFTYKMKNYALAHQLQA